MRVESTMTKKVTCVLRDDFLQDVHDAMHLLGVRHVPVVEQGRLVGIISDRDLLLHTRQIGTKTTFPNLMRAEDIMTKCVATCSIGAAVADVAQRMLELRIDALPVVEDDGSIVGIVTSTDILRLVANRDAVLLEAEAVAGFMDRFRWELPESMI